MWGDIAIAFLLAFIVAFMATPYTIKIAKKVGAVDIPKDQRRMHKKLSISHIFINSNEYGKHNRSIC